MYYINPWLKLAWQIDIMPCLINSWREMLQLQLHSILWSPLCTYVYYTYHILYITYIILCIRTCILSMDTTVYTCEAPVQVALHMILVMGAALGESVNAYKIRKMDATALSKQLCILKLVAYINGHHYLQWTLPLPWSDCPSVPLVEWEQWHHLSMSGRIGRQRVASKRWAVRGCCCNRQRHKTGHVHTNMRMS